MDHVAGLLGLREGPCIDLWATPCVFEFLTSGLPLLNVLQHYCGARWHMIAGPGRTFDASGASWRSKRFRVAGAPRGTWVGITWRSRARVRIFARRRARRGTTVAASRVPCRQFAGDSDSLCKGQ